MLLAGTAFAAPDSHQPYRYAVQGDTPAMLQQSVRTSGTLKSYDVPAYRNNNSWIYDLHYASEPSSSRQTSRAYRRHVNSDERVWSGQTMMPVVGPSNMLGGSGVFSNF